MGVDGHDGYQFLAGAGHHLAGDDLDRRLAAPRNRARSHHADSSSRYGGVQSCRGMARRQSRRRSPESRRYTVMLWFFSCSASLRRFPPHAMAARSRTRVMASKRPAAAPPVRALEPRRRSWDRRPGSALTDRRGFSLQALGCARTNGPFWRAARVCAATCAIDRRRRACPRARPAWRNMPRDEGAHQCAREHGPMAAAVPFSSSSALLAQPSGRVRACR